MLPPAAEDTTTVTANDRVLCYACHAEAQATWLGSDVYDNETTQTVHGSSSIEVSVTAEYASEETTRLAGECQSCHNPMGSDNGDGEPIAKLAELEGRELCYSCHNAENEDDGITDMASYGVFPEDIAGEPELVVAWDPANLPAAYGGLHVYTRAFGDDVAPYDLEGPRRYRVANGMDGRTGSIAYGDIDGLGGTELVVADPANFRPEGTSARSRSPVSHTQATASRRRRPSSRSGSSSRTAAPFPRLPRSVSRPAARATCASTVGREVVLSLPACTR
jgi:predicted CXXCH cytochrome family protein